MIAKTVTDYGSYKYVKAEALKRANATGEIQWLFFSAGEGEWFNRWYYDSRRPVEKPGIEDIQQVLPARVEAPTHDQH